MQYSGTLQPGKKRKSKVKTSGGSSHASVPGVMETVPGTFGNEKAGKILSEILTRPGRIEEKTGEAVYPPESAIRPAYIKKIKEAEAGLAKGKGKTYPSMDDFIRHIRQ